MRASVVLKRPKLAVQTKARQLGRPFRDVRDVKADRLARETDAIEANGRSDARKQQPLARDNGNVEITGESRQCRRFFPAGTDFL